MAGFTCIRMKHLIFQLKKIQFLSTYSVDILFGLTLCICVLTCSLDITTVCDLTQPFDSCFRFMSLATGGAGVKTNPEAAPEDSQTRQLGAGAELLNRYLVQVARQVSDTGAIGCDGQHPSI